MVVVSLAGSPSQRSRSGVLLEHGRDWLQRRGIEVVSYRVRDFDAEDLLHARFDSPLVRRFVEHVALADGLLIATPIYKASFAGALKVLLDLLPERALAHKAVLPMASGGSVAHMLAVDYALKPVLAALKAQEMLQGVYAVDAQIHYGEPGHPSSLEPDLQARLEEGLEQLHAALARRPAPLDPGLLPERLNSAQWSI
ncbi:NADPH-dependent FMN reductase [Stutzerimonas nosocomialis]|uniref:NADPH-dependent FMN reductase n=1 Tax=Stutzerimonas nosocomialis TaxID=1056496 RepID=A0A5R9QJA5_9GAMM|nr:NADPH-dependent FMN reductase [Stutzerimonas nosocomialis]TLX56525.1 NADPH-dependent FMN reductase [Stutzerimonas nosocomialis]TLX65042.1 NADPH-dependent FMN reductase [Stutzerimonas nosocomialis]